MNRYGGTQSLFALVHIITLLPIGCRVHVYFN